MTLTNRLLLFFLSTLTMILAVFSVSLYVLARTHLTRQVDAWAQANLDTLMAAAEVEPEGIEWERQDRRLWASEQNAPLRWGVFDAQGRVVDGTRAHLAWLRDYATLGDRRPEGRLDTTWQGSRWWVYRRRLTQPGQKPAVTEGPISKPRQEKEKCYQELTFVIAAPVQPMEQSLKYLAWAMAGVSLLVCFGVAVSGRRICQQALIPVTQMSAAARAIHADDLSHRLPVPASGDELSNLAGTFNDLLDRLQESFERQRHFTSEASHQLRTPLTAILGQLEVALRRERSPEEYRRVLTSTVRQAGRLRQISESLVFLARADLDAPLPGLEVIDLTDWIPRQIAQAWSEHPRYPDLQVPPPGSTALPVLAQPILLSQAIDNLIDNALKYSPPGSPVHIQLDRDGDRVVFQVRDQGVGIPERDQVRIFDPFFRGDEARRRGIPGTGLGLSITARIVTALGGNISVRSREAVGSQFEVSFCVDKRF